MSANFASCHDATIMLMAPCPTFLKQPECKKYNIKCFRTFVPAKYHHSACEMHVVEFLQLQNIGQYSFDYDTYL